MRKITKQRTTTPFTKLLINFLLESTLWITLLISTLLLKSLCFWCWCGFNRTRIDINTARLSNTLSINFLGFDNEDSVRKRFLALSTREFVGEDLDLDTEDTLAEEDVTSSRVNEIADLPLD